MIRISRIDGIDEDSLALLEAAGFQNVASLARITPIALQQELSGANRLLRIVASVPEPSILRQWIDRARELSGVGEMVPEGITSDAIEGRPAVLEVLESAPVAVPLPARMLVEKNLGVDDVPSAIPLDKTTCYLDTKIATFTEVAPANPTVASEFVKLSKPGGARFEIDASRLRSTEDYADPSAPAVESLPDDVDRLVLLRSPRKETNKGRNPESRRYVRGILHTTPVRIYCGALVTLLMMLIIPLATAATFLLLVSSYQPKIFSWAPSWLIALPIALPILGLFYAVLANNSSCRVCCQKLFIPKPHLKNSRAHHVKVLGYILPLCAHIILLRWFRCTHCGTPIRLKE
jgi:hypothetical protein